MLPFLSLRNMEDLCPKGIYLGVTPSAPSCPPTLLDEMEDRRQRDKEKKVSPNYLWYHMHRAAREAEEQPHKLLPLHEAPTRRSNQSMRVNKRFSYQEVQRIKEELGDYLDNPEKYIRTFKVLLYDLTWKDVMYILGQTVTPDSKIRVLRKAVAYGDEWLDKEGRTDSRPPYWESGSPHYRARLEL